MDQLGKSINNLSLWEVKSYVRKAQNAVLNLSDIEAKVREATNNEPWGASTTLMAEIARGTFNYRDREEICNMIFRRFTEKSANEWRQIYKSLQLMEYLVKNGSERFVDDARANVSLVSMLKSFHYIDSKGVDQGINIRNRAKELTNLLNDEVKIRQERKKAKENSKKFDAISSVSAGSRNLRNATSSINNDGYENRIFGDGGVYGQRFEENRSTVSSPHEFEEYDEDAGHSSNHHPNNTNNNSTYNSRRSSKPTVETNKVNVNGNGNSSTADYVDLFDIGETKKPAPVGGDINNEDFDDDDDDFNDFQSATVTAAPSNNLANLLTSSYGVSTAATTKTYTGAAATPAAAINQPKPVDDLFGSLLMSAKQTSTPTPAPTPAARQQQQQQHVAYPPPAPRQQASGEVNLLDL